MSESTGAAPAGGALRVRALDLRISFFARRAPKVNTNVRLMF
jgi:hypothetical protein